MKLSIVSLNFNKPDLTVSSMESLYQEYKEEFKNGEFEYIIVDNNSTDNSLEILHKEIKKYKHVTLIENSKNSGFGSGNNMGATHAKGEYILFLNNDTRITSKGFLDMVSFLDTHKEVAILGGKLENNDGTEQISTGKFYSPFSLFLLMLGLQRLGGVDKNPSQVQKVDWVKGALLMIRKLAFEKLGGFDEKIFMYTEDMELCYRAREAGMQVFFYPISGILHKDQGSSNRTFAIVLIYKNLLYFYKKHRPIWEYNFAWLLLKLKAVILICVGKLFHNTYLVSTYEQALAVF